MALFSKKTEEGQEEKKQEKSADVAVASANVSLNLPLVLIRPRISEKASTLAHLNKYTFIVKRGTNKVEVKKAVEARYKVKVLTVNVTNTKGKEKNFGRTAGRTSDFKKAIVTLKQGDKIEGLTDVA